MATLKAYRVTISIVTQRFSEPKSWGSKPSDVTIDKDMLVYAYTKDQAEKIAKGFFRPLYKPNSVGCKELLTLDPPPDCAENDT